MKTRFSKLLAIMLVIAMMANFVVPGLAIDVPEGCQCDPATRTGEYLSTVEPTCTEYGYDVYVCDACGLQYSMNLVLPNGHSKVSVEAKAPTCTEIGWEAYEYCTVCDYSTYAELEATGHSYEADVTDPDCVNGGYTTYTCGCGDSYVADYTDPNGHKPGKIAIENVVGATCERPGSYDEVQYCDNCYEELSRNTVTVPATGHTANDPVEENRVDATCTEDGSYDIVVYCNCGEELSRETIVLPAVKHNYGEGPVQIVDATCTTPIIETYVCVDCGYVLEKVGEALGHDYINHDAKAPTCTEIGWDAYETCSRCDYSTYVELPALGHSYEETVVAPTCIDKGYTYYTCATCGDTYIDENSYVDADPEAHNHGVTKEYLAPTCVDDGHTAEIACFYCGDVLAVATVIPADPNAHKLNSFEAQDPTCTEDGWYAYEACELCGYSTIVLIPALGHEWVDPTCTEDGYCSICGEAGEAALGHDWVDATCTEDGYCSVCGEAGEAALGHEWVDPTCTEDGYCFVCGEIGDAAYGHDWVDPTCTEDGYCSNCGETGDMAFGHSWVDPTCTEDGYCSVCGEAGEPALDHDYIDHEGQNPTCTELGWNAYQTCSRCDYNTYEELDPIGHNEYGSRGYVDATCTNDGYWIAKCFNCGTFFIEDKNTAFGHTWVDPTCTEDGYCETCGEIGEAALGHDYEGVVTDPDCVNGGYTTYTCSVCGDSYIADEVGALGHDYEGVVTDPDCVNGGYTTYTCSVCGDSYVADEVGALGHKPGKSAVENVVGATCDRPGSYDEVQYCDVCFAEISRVNVVVPPLGHLEVTVPGYAPTFDEAGLTDGIVCDRCGETVKEQESIAPISESISFSYKAVGINGVANAVNSGYITVYVFMNVNTAQARLWGVDVDLKFHESLTLLSVDGCIFEQNLSTPLDVANADKAVKITQDMGYDADTLFEQGEYLFATLTFKVDKDFYSEDVGFIVNVDECNVARGDFANELDVDFGEGTEIHVNMLGDANLDGKITVADTMALSQWFAEADLDSYETIFDLNKDGFIDGDDFALLRGAVVRDNSYLDI